MRISERMRDLPKADIRKMTLACQEVGGYNLSQGVCDLPTPKSILQATAKAVEQDLSAYAPATGVEELKVALANKVVNENGLSQVTTENIMVTSGVTGGFASILTALTNPGDGVLLLEPYYGYHYNQCVIACCQPQVAELDAEFKVDVKLLEAALKPNTKMLVFSSPSNPSGRMFTEKELSDLLGFAKEHDLLIVADEIYEYFRYDDRKHLSLAAMPGAEDRVITMMGLSKTFSITGWRLGYLVVPSWCQEAIVKANDLLYVCAPTPLQHGVLAGFSLGRSYFDELIQEFTQKRNLFCSALEQAGLNPVVPEGSYYVLADVSGLNVENSIVASELILERAKVASVPGRAFFSGEKRDQYVRFCFAVADEVLAGATESLTSFIKGGR